jgi:hypothetical protein
MLSRGSVQRQDIAEQLQQDIAEQMKAHQAAVEQQQQQQQAAAEQQQQQAASEQQQQQAAAEEQAQQQAAREVQESDVQHAIAHVTEVLLQMQALIRQQQQMVQALIMLVAPLRTEHWP